MKFFKKIGIAAAFAISLAGFTGCEVPFIITGTVQYSNPSWAPPYYSGARYYYFPDVEMYYDMSDREFVYLNNGQWQYSSALPSIYAGFDLYSCFIITLNLTVYQPWMHHQYYVSHYPRYYYNNVYKGMDMGTIRGFNENERKPVYWQQSDKDRIKDLRKNEQPVRKPEVQKSPQKTNYYGKPIGEPVKVKPQMKKKEKEPQTKKPAGAR